MTKKDKTLDLNLVIAIIGCVIACFACIAAYLALPQIQNLFSGPMQGDRSSSKPLYDCSETTQVGVWPATTNVLVDATNGWVQADFWSPTQQFKDGYKEVSVIFEPGLRFTVNNVAGTAWLYDKSIWTAEGVQYCTTKHIEDTYKYLKNSYAQIIVEELCNKTQCPWEFSQLIKIPD